VVSTNTNEVREGGMVGRYVIHTEEHYIEEILEGQVTLSGMAALLQAALSDTAMDPSFDGLVDLRAAQIKLSYDEVRQIAHGLKNDHRASRGYWAFVVSNDLGHGIVRMFEALSDDAITVQIFRDREKALAWLVSRRA
jgi:hypothetical protein